MHDTSRYAPTIRSVIGEDHGHVRGSDEFHNCRECLRRTFAVADIMLGAVPPGADPCDHRDELIRALGGLGHLADQFLAQL